MIGQGIPDTNMRIAFWQEALTQADAGWPSPPCTFDETGTLLNTDAEGVNVAFRFAVIQPDKIRDCDDLKYGLVNRCCAADTPIKLPTWGRIGELCLRIRHTNRPWAFFRADRKAAYKHLALNPDHAGLCAVALRCPTDLEWYGFFPRALLFGAVAAVLRYNIFSRKISLVVCSFF